MPTSRELEKQPFVDWFKAHDLYWDEKRQLWGAYWSDRAGMEHASLEFIAWENEKYPTRWDAVMGHHASGTNPRMAIGTCESVADVARIYEAVRLINGYKQPEGAPANTRLEVLVREALQLSDDLLDMKVEEIARELGIPESEWYSMSDHQRRHTHG